MKSTTTIHVHCCEVCGDHATEEDYTCVDTDPLYGLSIRPEVKNLVGHRGIFVPFMARCPDCGLLACYSCLEEGFCCERKVDVEAHSGQKGLFE